MGRRDGLSADKPKAVPAKPVQQKPALDIKTKSDIRGSRPTGIILDQMRDLATPRSFDSKTGKAPKKAE